MAWQSDMTVEQRWEVADAQRQLPWLLVAVMVSLDLVLNPRYDQFPHLGAAAYVGFCIGQIAVVAVWLVLGRLPFLLRLLGALGTVGFLAYPISERTKPDSTEMIGALGLLLLTISLPTLLLRFHGMAIEAAGLAQRPTGGQRRWQFSIAALFVAMTSTAIILTTVRWARFPWHAAGSIAGYCAGFALVAAVAFTAMYWRDRWTLRLVVCVSLVALIGYGLAQLERGLPQWNTDWIAACVSLSLAEFTTIGAMIAVIRISGYRLVRKPGA